MKVVVLYTDEFGTWWESLTTTQQEDVTHIVGVLEEKGVTLDHPYASAIKGSRKLRELRIQSGGGPLRVFYVFDPKRQAVLLIGGDKTGQDRFYEEMVPKAEKIYRDYLKEVGTDDG